MPERMVAELAEVACGLPCGSLGWWWGAIRFLWVVVAAIRFFWVAAIRFSWVVVGWCGHTVLLVGGGGYHTVLVGGCAIKNKIKNGYGSCGV